MNDKAKPSPQMLAALAALPSRLLACQHRWEQSGHSDTQALLGALYFYKPQLPEWLFDALEQQLIARLPQATTDELRHHVLLSCRDGGQLPWKEAKARAREMLAGTYAAGSPAAIWESYKRVERKRPKELRRPRTYQR